MIGKVFIETDHESLLFSENCEYKTNEFSLEYSVEEISKHQSSIE